MVSVKPAIDLSLLADFIREMKKHTFVFVTQYYETLFGIIGGSEKSRFGIW